MLQFHIATNLEFNTDVTDLARVFRSLDTNHNGEIEPNEIDESVESSLKQLKKLENWKTWKTTGKLEPN